MRKLEEFVDYYELLEVSSNASRETIERVFRYLAKRFHPDSAEQPDVKKFALLVEACEKLANPESRANYDIEYERHKQHMKSLVEETGHVNSDCSDRHRLLSLFYAQRRRNRKQPGIGGTTLEQVMGLPNDILEFHLWYFREKGWINREESGLLSITARGVDQIEATVHMAEPEKYKRLEFASFSADNALLQASAAETKTTSRTAATSAADCPESCEGSSCGPETAASAATAN